MCVCVVAERPGASGREGVHPSLRDLFRAETGPRGHFVSLGLSIVKRGAELVCTLGANHGVWRITLSFGRIKDHTVGLKSIVTRDVSKSST